MTLLYTEIVPPIVWKRHYIFFAADQRITPLDGSKPRFYKKLIEIPYLNAALGFFGLAEWGKGSSRTLMSELLRDFVRKQSSILHLGTFAALLADYLNKEVPGNLLGKRSGIHIAGFGPTGVPEFWFVRNIDDQGAASLGQYQAREEFLTYATKLGFDGKDLSRLPDVSIFYRNGDIATHATAWEMIDEALVALRGTPGFKPIRTPEDYGEWIRFKMNVLRSFHGRFQKQVLIGGKIDVLKLDGPVVKR